MITALAQDLLTRVESLAALTNRTGLSIGGRTNDPGLLKIPLPAAWIVLKNDTVDESSFQRGPESGLVPPSQEMMATFAITLFVPYINDADLLTTQYPLLESVWGAIHAKESPSGYRWRYIGQHIALVYPDRICYEQRFTVSFVTNA